MERQVNWHNALSDYILGCSSRPFSYADGFDCGTFVIGAIESLTGVDVAPELKGKYTNRKQAFAAIRKLCGAATMEAIASYLANKHGIPEVPVYFAQRGDPVVLKQGKTSTLGIVDMVPGFILTPYKDGLLRLPIDHATKAYHI